MKLFAEAINKNPEDSKSEKVNAYDQKTSDQETEDFKKETIEIIKKKQET